jgi:hypothetical protein
LGDGHAIIFYGNTIICFDYCNRRTGLAVRYRTPINISAAGLSAGAAEYLFEKIIDLEKVLKKQDW